MDLFCGAGGSSLGAERVAGVELRLAMNHWQKAIDVHQQHFPDAGHDCADISQADPRRYERTDILLASPECTNHSQAKGVSRKKQQQSLFDKPDPSAERSRATMWDVPRFAEQMFYDAIVVENVVEATKWVGWRAWCMSMEDLGYQRTVLSQNSMFHGVPQSRDRIYVVFTRNGLNPDLEFTQLAHCPICPGSRRRRCRQVFKNAQRIGKYKTQWFWACTGCGGQVHPEVNGAEQIIDWSLEAPRIGDRKKPLKPNTRKRILAGLQRHGWVPVVTAGAGNTHERTPGNRARPLDQPLATQQTTATHALATPPSSFLFQTAHGGRFHELDAPHPTICASDDRLSLIEPSEDALLVSMRRNGTAQPLSKPAGAFTAGGNNHALLVRNQRLTQGDNGWMTTSTDDPVHTLTGKQSQSVLDPAEVVDDCGFRMLEPYEAAAAMAFPTGYIPRDLDKKDQMRLAGNAVTPPVMTPIVRRIVEAMAA